MTQKELAYVEDAISHEQIITKICEDMLSKICDEELKTFMENEISKHGSMKEKLISLLEAKNNG